MESYVQQMIRDREEFIAQAFRKNITTTNRIIELNKRLVLLSEKVRKL
ncbi:hypothetical protein SAMN05216167_102749 [Spirosoma endophyticum]|uniref:Uncharacterized protein n=1 Tax=Spirosoma endophyticum TaxID=662367 RepID=A0A1I1MWS6_9BACT|nr:hypothetical protein SAMN05216167_102749 [Spirosoma endophyticum]